MTYTAESAASALSTGEATVESIAAVTGWPIIEGCLIPEPGKWHAGDGNAEIVIEADCDEDAAKKYVNSGDWGTPEETCWVTVSVWREGIDEDGDTCYVERDFHKIQLDPTAPKCSDGQEHDWQSPHEIVGGIKENPGVWGHGGGIIIHECCMHCGAAKITDTWAQDKNDGEQGLTSLKYEPRKYAQQIEALQTK